MRYRYVSDISNFCTQNNMNNSNVEVTKVSSYIQNKFTNLEQVGYEESTGIIGQSPTTGIKENRCMVQNGVGAIIPFASAYGRVASTTISGNPKTGTPLGFGSSYPSILLGNEGSINIDSDGANMGLILPREGIITGISGFYSLVNDVTIPSCNIVIVSLELYKSILGSNNFTPIVGTLLDLSPALTDISRAGVVGSATKELAIPVLAGERILLVGKIRMTGVSATEISVNLSFSGGIAIG
ncbi:hypothetical protein ACQPU1_13320 [Clostridium paraputrificum]|uniref:hypothetical protein n=1 Tax=Clostridium paraputrificum TaxID=29363 RepID=UPI003D336B50